MKIIVKRNEQSPEVTIDTIGLIYSWQFEQAFKLALKQEGFTEQFIFEVFNETEETED